MAFIKTGEATDILTCFDEEGDVRCCPECGRKLTMIELADEDNSFICDCQTQPTEELNQEY